MIAWSDLYYFCICSAVCCPCRRRWPWGGVVLDGADRAPLPGASVVVKGPDNKIKKFATSNAEGRFSLTVPGVVGCRLEVSLMSYRRQSFPLDSVSLPLTVLMEPGAIELREVAVKADRIREQGDTVTYNVGSFAQQADRSIGDVLKRMPGIDVSKSGKISYQGEDINKFYIEGSDLLGGKYGVATNGIGHEDVGAVEVLENHQPLPGARRPQLLRQGCRQPEAKEPRQGHLVLPRRCRRRLGLAARRSRLRRPALRHGRHARFPEHHHPARQQYRR